MLIVWVKVLPALAPIVMVLLALLVCPTVMFPVAPVLPIVTAPVVVLTTNLSVLTVKLPATLSGPFIKPAPRLSMEKRVTPLACSSIPKASSAPIITLVPKVLPPCKMSPLPPVPAQLPLVRQTVPVASGKVMVLLVVGSAMVKVVVKALSVAPWKTSGLPPVSWLVIPRRSVVALPIVVLPLTVMLPVITALLSTVKPVPAALAVRAPLKVLAPAKVWAPVLTRPGLEASAVCM